TQGRYDEAEALHKRSLSVYVQKLGPGHPDTSIALGNYAGLLRTMNRNEEAAALEARIKKK
ncbi:MAG TPA: tetratricopeptide repeat protein, partial [Ktedonobacteraceae bacterium]|nr:tetratricopeptide repeat protein [Ktedonobacteraceae bacterium]